MKNTQKEINKLDVAARAGWLYYVAGYTQDQIAKEFNISRQSAQRMVSLSVSSKLIKVRLDHPIANCMELAKKLKEKYSLKECEITPSVGDDKNSIIGIGEAGAKVMEKYLQDKKPAIIAVGTGKVLKMVTKELSPMDCERHRIVSLVGNMTNDGSASSYEVVSRIADIINATYYPMPLPIIMSSVQEKESLHKQQFTNNVLALAKQADIFFVGIGQIDKKAPLYIDGFISKDELTSLIKIGSAGEIIGWIYDKGENFIKGYTNDRVTSFPIVNNSKKLVIGIAAGEHKAQAIKAALKGKLINGLVTNETTAEIILGTLA